MEEVGYNKKQVYKEKCTRKNKKKKRVYEFERAKKARHFLK